MANTSARTGTVRGFEYPAAFWAGALACLVGVLSQLVTDYGARDMGYRMSGVTPMTPETPMMPKTPMTPKTPKTPMTPDAELGGVLRRAGVPSIAQTAVIGAVPPALAFLAFLAFLALKAVAGGTLVGEPV